MKKITLLTLFVLCNLYANAQKRGWFDDYLIGVGLDRTYKTDNLGNLGAHLETKFGYNWKHFFINAGVGLLYLEGNKPDPNLSYPSAQRERDLLAEFPVGIGLNFPVDNSIVTLGTDVSYLTDINFSTSAIAIGPIFSTFFNTKHKNPIGFHIKTLINLSNNATYAPVYVGIGISIRSL